jgi:hypothetical protein
MTGPDPRTTEEPGQLAEQAIAGLEDLRQVLLQVGRCEGDPAELRDTALAYWHGHRPVLTALASALGEQLRLQTLQALYEWRASLDRSQPSHRNPPR